MLHTISDELARAAASVGTEQVTSLAPIYLCGCDLHADTLNDAGEMLLHTLEEDGIFDPLQDACVLLSITAEEHVSENEMRRIGLTDRFGQYRHSLSGWLRYLSADLHITTGAILIRAESLSVLRSDPEWWNIQMQCMESRKHAFVFVILCSPAHLPALHGTVSPRCHCRIAEAQTVSPEAYADIFASAVEPYRLTLSPEARAQITETVRACSGTVSIMQTVQWARTAAWEYMTAEHTAHDGILRAEDIGADAFREKHSLSAASGDERRIGY